MFANFENKQKMQIIQGWTNNKFDFQNVSPCIKVSDLSIENNAKILKDTQNLKILWRVNNLLNIHALCKRVHQYLMILVIYKCRLIQDLIIQTGYITLIVNLGRLLLITACLCNCLIVLDVILIGKRTMICSCIQVFRILTRHACNMALDGVFVCLATHNLSDIVGG